MKNKIIILPLFLFLLGTTMVFLVPGEVDAEVSPARRAPFFVWVQELLPWALEMPGLHAAWGWNR